MLSFKQTFCFLCSILLSFFCVSAQDTISYFSDYSETDTIVYNSLKLEKTEQISLKQFVVPTILIGYGVLSLNTPIVENVDLSVRNYLRDNSPKRTVLDDYTQYFPVAMVYGFNLAGIKGKHNYLDVTVLYATSKLISALFVTSLKHSVNRERPDGSNNLSFPSGHTATAFVSAQLLYKEYRDKNIWLSLSGYPFAVFTGVYRVINERHWVGDVIAGAGFGMLSTELAYLLNPMFNRLLPFKKKDKTATLLPFYQNGSYGLSFVSSF